MIILSDKEPKFYGTTRAVYAHPDDPKLIIKIPRQSWLQKLKKKNALKRWWKGLHSDAINRSEYREYFTNKHDIKNHLVIVHDLIKTDLGLGLVVQMEYDEAGLPARSIHAYIYEIEKYQTQIDEFITWVQQTNIVIHDLDLSNVLLSWRNKKPTLVIIDGFGETSFIKRRTWFRKRNHKKNKQEIEFFLSLLEHHIQLHKQTLFN